MEKSFAGLNVIAMFDGEHFKCIRKAGKILDFAHDFEGPCLAFCLIISIF